MVAWKTTKHDFLIGNIKKKTNQKNQKFYLLALSVASFFGLGFLDLLKYCSTE